ncbi:hypothetical protein TNIN_235951 [Trichonephila inaurata madagascariensis]|uniref:Uncharacterized protein n=1 Tax=Trichonephila inaurata madagascariensis TaxID=2747483 RepID=A0A8X6WN79_9ARAC|nr:hypothetical protein TNIN_235951 [Trichonephila inaurata madagascariensis]
MYAKTDRSVTFEQPTCQTNQDPSSPVSKATIQRTQDGPYSDADGRSLDLQCQNRIGKNCFNLNRNIRIKLLLIGKGLPTPWVRFFTLSNKRKFKCQTRNVEK